MEKSKFRYTYFVYPDWSYITKGNSHKVKGLSSILDTFNNGLDIYKDINYGDSTMVWQSNIDEFGEAKVLEYFANKYQARSKFLSKDSPNGSIPVYLIKIPEEYVYGDTDDPKIGLPLPWLIKFNDKFRKTITAPVDLDKVDYYHKVPRFSEKGDMPKLAPQFVRGVYFKEIGWTGNSNWCPIYNPYGYTFSGFQYPDLKRVGEQDILNIQDAGKSYEELKKLQEQHILPFFLHHNADEIIDYYKNKFKDVHETMECKWPEDIMMNRLFERWNVTSDLDRLK